MKFLNTATGEMFDNISDAVAEFCAKHSTCRICGLRDRKPLVGCRDWALENPEEALKIMGLVPVMQRNKTVEAVIAEINAAMIDCDRNECNMPAPPSIEDRIKSRLNRADIAIKLAKESNDLAQAAWKMRILEGDNNPVRMAEEAVLNNLIEELADISLCIKLLDLDTGIVRMKIAKVMRDKAECWANSLEKNANRFC